MNLYIYRNVITLDKLNMEDHLYHINMDYYTANEIDFKVDIEWRKVETIKNVTLEQVMKYVNDCYRMLEYSWAYKEV